MIYIEKILFLGYEDCKLLTFLQKHYDVIQTKDKITIENVKNVDHIISFGYKHIIPKNIIKFFNNKIINLHISYLPYNRGSHPNFWSFKDNTPKGVTIHYIDKGIDTGDILLQKKIKFTDKENTLSKTYDRLIEEIQNLFIENYFCILNGIKKPIPQQGKGTFHYKKDLEKYKNLLIKDWNTKTNKVMAKKRTDLEIIDEVENIRTKNNVNWMDILRLAFKHAPEDARTLMGKVNKYDGRISVLLTELSNNGK
tara:strand:- start:7351 stop:8109 length:759 start_codon:yes stop_codon:yes gene_type:complete